MTKESAPKPPAGWYPFDDGQPGKKYWDGNAWTGKTRGTKKVQLPDSKDNGAAPNKKKNLVIGASAIVVVLVVVLTVFIATRDSRVYVPDVEGLAEADAIQLVETAGLVAEVETGNSGTGKKAGIADSSEPGVNAKVEKGSTVKILISNGKADEGSSFFDSSGSSSAAGWAPSGFSVFNDDVAIQWVQGGPDPCDSVSCTYTTLNVTPHHGCPRGVYVEVNFMDAAGTVFDWSNDTVPALEAGQVAQLQFVSYESSGGGTVQIANVSCN